MAKFNPGWKMTLVVLLLMPLLLRLGFWQLARAEEKRAILNEISAKQSLAPERLVLGNVPSSYTPVSLSGRFADQHFLIDNKVFQGRVGYEVLSLFRDNSGVKVLVNRGFVEGFASREQLPTFETPVHTLELTGTVHRNLGDPYLLKEQQVTALQSPMVLQAFEPALLRNLIPDLNFDDAYIRLDEGQRSQFAYSYVPVNVNPEKHTAYAVQWFALSAALLVLYVLFGLGKLAPKREVVE